VSHTILPLFDKTAVLYRRELSLLTQTIENVSDANTIQPLIDRIVRPDSPGQLEHFEIFFMLYARLSSTTVPVNFTPIQTILPIFCAYATQIADDIRDPEYSGRVWKVFKAFFGLQIDEISEVSGQLAFFFQFGETLLMSDLLTKRLVGARILAELSRFPTPFNAWKATTQLGQFLVEHDLHSQLLEILESFLGQLLTAPVLDIFWEKVETVHSSAGGGCHHQQVARSAGRRYPNDLLGT
jgi:hypothetical protein